MCTRVFAHIGHMYTHVPILLYFHFLKNDFDQQKRLILMRFISSHIFIADILLSSIRNLCYCQYYIFSSMIFQVEVLYLEVSASQRYRLQFLYRFKDDSKIIFIKQVSFKILPFQTTNTFSRIFFFFKGLIFRFYFSTILSGLL